MEALLQPYPVDLSSSSPAAGAAAGRSLVATAAIAKGSLILRSAPAAATAHRKHLPLLCLHCLRFSQHPHEPLPVRCAGGFFFR